MTSKMVFCEYLKAATQEIYINAIHMSTWVTRKTRRESCHISPDLKPELLLCCKLGCATMKILLVKQGDGE